MKSALYVGRVRHRRYAVASTGDVAHEFEYPITMPLIYLSELDEVTALHPRISRERANLLTWRRRDFFGDGDPDLAEAVRSLVAERTGQRPTGEIAVLGHVRTWGCLFNPLTVYYCFDDHDRVAWVVLEVRNTPWLERHHYVLSGDAAQHTFAKELHVSPFLPMAYTYDFTWHGPDDRLRLHLGNRRGDERAFDASLSLTRRELTSTVVHDWVWRQPLETYSVIAGIYRQAWRLFRKKAPFFSHPHKQETAP